MHYNKPKELIEMELYNLNVANAPKTSTFQMRINPEIKQQVEDIYSRQGLTFTDAVNIFIQQSINSNGLPFLASAENEEFLKSKAMRRLAEEIQKGWASVQSEDDWISEDEAYRMLDLDK